MAASPAVAERIGVDHLHFVKRYFAVLPAALAMMFAVSLQTPRSVRRIAIAGFAVAVALMVATFVHRRRDQGRAALDRAAVASRSSPRNSSSRPSPWSPPGCSPSQRETPAFPGQSIAVGLFLLVLFLLDPQPDFGMAFVVSAVWFAQFFLAGLRLALGGGVPGRRRTGPGRGLFHPAACAPAASTASSIRPAATATRSTARSTPS